MHPASLIILVLSHAGYWLAGTDGTVAARWTVPAQAPQATLFWELSIESVQLDRGSIPMNSAGRDTHITIRCPDVRARTELSFRYRLVSPDGKTELASGTAVVYAFPVDLTVGWPSELTGKNVVVVDSPDRLPALLTRAKVAFTRLEQVADLQLARPDIVLVGVDRMDPSPLVQEIVPRLARSGAGVIIFEQSRIDRLNALTVVRRARPEKVEWVTDHPLLAGFNADDLARWLPEMPREISVVRLMASATALPVACLPRDPDFSSIDALVAVRSIGSGRIILSQLPLADCRTDPRTIMFIGNALDYLSPSKGADFVDRRTPAGVFKPGSRTVLTPAGDDR